jgi:cytochrome c5
MNLFSNKWLLVILLIVSGVLGLIVSLYVHNDNELAVDDVQTIQIFHNPSLFVSQLTGDPQAGRKIYKEFCMSCHAKKPVIEVKAPKVGVMKDWKRWRGVNEKVLLVKTIRGVGAMPARGGCFECSDKQLQQTIEFMLHQK